MEHVRHIGPPSSPALSTANKEISYSSHPLPSLATPRLACDWTVKSCLAVALSCTRFPAEICLPFLLHASMHTPTTPSWGHCYIKKKKRKTCTHSPEAWLFCHAFEMCTWNSSLSPQFGSFCTSQSTRDVPACRACDLRGIKIRATAGLEIVLMKNVAEVDLTFPSSVKGFIRHVRHWAALKDRNKY